MLNEYGVIIGWALGILSTPIVGLITDYKERENIRKGLLAELSDVRGRTLGATYRLAINDQSFNVEFVEWFLKNLRTISGTRIDKVLKLTETYGPVLRREITPQQLVSQTQTPHRSLTLALIETPFLDSKMSSIHLLTQGQQERIFAFKRQVSFINQNITKLEGWNKMSFEVTTAGNHAACLENERSCIRALLNHSKQLVEEVEDYFKEPSLC